MNSTAYDFAMGSAKKIRVVQIGLGHIGLEAVKVLLGKPQFQIVGVVDIDPRKVGRKLPEFLEDKKAPDVDISASVPECLRASRADVAIHTTGSFLKDAFPQLREIVEAGAHCVSSAEELSFPRFRNPELSEELHRLAKRKKVAVLGTGVNPGFVMEVLPLCLSGVCQTAERIDVRRVLNAAKRRLPLQIKVGAGMTRAEFTRKAQEGKLGHVGLLESMMLLAEGLGWKLEKWREKIEPKIAPRKLSSEYLTIPKGRVAGLHQVATGWRGGKVVLTLDLAMYLGAEESFDSVTIHGVPPIEVKAHGGIAGDRATVAALVNSAQSVARAGKTGLLTMKDLPVPRLA